MKTRHALILCILQFALAARLGAQKIDLEKPFGGPPGAGPKNLTIIGPKSTELTVTVTPGTVVAKGGAAADKKPSIDITTDTTGKAPVTIEPGKANQEVILTVGPKGGSPDSVTRFKFVDLEKYGVETTTGPLIAQHIFPDALVITAKGANDQPASLQSLNVSVIGNTDALLFQDNSGPHQKVMEVTTDDTGVAKVSVQTGQDLDIELRVDPLGSDGKEIVVGEKTVKLSGLRQFDTFHSRRLYTELFMGATFTNDYDANGKSTGFNKTAPIVRATFDTLWSHRTIRDCEPPMVAAQRQALTDERQELLTEQKKTVTDAQYKTKRAEQRARLAAINKELAELETLYCPTPLGPVLRGSLWHTGVDLEVSSFPFGKGTQESNTGSTENPGDPNQPQENTPKGFDNAFTGDLFAVYQPDKWASYTNTSELNGFQTDALRLGVFGKAGMTTQPNLGKNGDSALWRFQVGLRFTHHQTKVDRPYAEQDNIVPIRFIEISYAKFEEFGGKRNTNRLVLDAGFRLPGMGSNQIPFYAGIHLNGGRGVDDLRIFAGFLFKINELATLFQGAQPK